MKNQKQQRGMAALSMIMIIVVLLAVIGTVVATSRTSSTSTSSETGKLHAASIIDQGNTLRTGLQVMVNKGTATLDSITMTATNASDGSTYGLFNGTTGGTVRQAPPGEAVSDPANAKWVYFKRTNGLEVAGVSADASGSYAVALTHVKDSVCKQINASHYGAAHATATTIPTAGGSGIPASTADLATAAYKISNYNDTSGTTLNWSFGCVATGTANQNLYFNIVQP